MLPMMNDPTLSRATELIYLNNHAVALLREGCLFGALDILCKAKNSLNAATPTPTITMSSTAKPLQIVENSNDDILSINKKKNNNNNRSSPRRKGTSAPCYHHRHCHHRYLYEWVDCAPGATSFQDEDPTRDDYCSRGCSTTETSSLFLCLHAIQIYETSTCNPPNDEINDCFYGIDWAVWYNFGVVNSLIGFRLGDKGRILLERAHNSFKRSQLLIPSDGVVASIYLRLLVSALNNELFCLLELGLYDESCSCLNQMIDLLQFCGPKTFIGRDDFERQILLNLLVLSKRHILAAAA